MTEQPAEHQPPEYPGHDFATPEHRVARSLRANDLTNALITSREDMPAAVGLVEDAINEDGPMGFGGAIEQIRMLANVVLSLTNRIAIYAREIDTCHNDPEYFTNKHAKAVMEQVVNPTIVTLNRHQDGEE